MNEAGQAACNTVASRSPRGRYQWRHCRVPNRAGTLLRVAFSRELSGWEQLARKVTVHGEDGENGLHIGKSTYTRPSSSQRGAIHVPPPSLTENAVSRSISRLNTRKVYNPESCSLFSALWPAARYHTQKLADPFLVEHRVPSTACEEAMASFFDIKARKAAAAAAAANGASASSSDRRPETTRMQPWVEK